MNNNSFNITKNTECQEFNFDGDFYRSYHTVDVNGNVNENALAILNSKTDEIVYVNNQEKNQIKEINHKIITNDFFNFLKDNKLISDNLDYNEFKPIDKINFFIENNLNTKSTNIQNVDNHVYDEIIFKTEQSTYMFKQNDDVYIINNQNINGKESHLTIDKYNSQTKTTEFVLGLHKENYIKKIINLQYNPNLFTKEIQNKINNELKLELNDEFLKTGNKVEINQESKNKINIKINDCQYQLEKNNTSNGHSVTIVDDNNMIVFEKNHVDLGFDKYDSIEYNGKKFDENLWMIFNSNDKTNKLFPTYPTFKSFQKSGHDFSEFERNEVCNNIDNER